MHALTRTPDLELSVRSRRQACVLDPTLLLASPQGLLLARQLSTVMDIWLCPALWRLLDASEFFQRSPARLIRWLGLPSDWPLDSVSQALTLCSRWRASHDISALGMYWVGLHQTESYLPEQGPRQLPQHFESLLTRWQQPDASEHSANGLQPDEHQTSAPDLAQECAALSVALQGAPILTCNPTRQAEPPPALLTLLADQGLPMRTWPMPLHTVRDAEHQRWWHLLCHCGAAPTVATGLNLSVVQVVAPLAQFMDVPLATDSDALWADNTYGDAWPADTPPDLPAPPHLDGWWQHAQALWFNL